MILDGDGLFVSVSGGRKSDYCSCAFAIWTSTQEKAEQVKNVIIGKAGAFRSSIEVDAILATGTSRC